MESVSGNNFNLKLVSSNLIEGSLEGKLDLEVAQNAVNGRKKLGDGKDMLLLMYIDDVKSINNEALKYFSNEGNEELKASALVIGNSMIANHLVNSLLSLVTKKPPVKIFKDRNNAVEWLTQV